MSIVAAAIITGVVSILSQQEENMALDRAKKEDKILSEKMRQDELALNASNKMLSEKQLGINRDSLDWTKRYQAQSLGFQKQVRQQDVARSNIRERYMQAADMLNQNQSMLNNISNIWNRGK